MGCSNSKNATEAAVDTVQPSLQHVSSVGDLRYNMLKESRVDHFDELFELSEGELGAAAMGCVVRSATKKRTAEKFACKTFVLSSVKGKQEQQRILALLRNEIEMLRSLDHPNIVRAYESYKSSGDLHLIMELCTGGDLGARRCTEAQAANVIRQCLSAISYAHHRGICHRDLKFENILWESPSPEAHIKLIDFGMSRRFMQGVAMKERVGSVYTMAPEVLKGEYTEKADLWSVGCITFHLIAGEPAFECENEVDTMRRLLAVSYFWPKGSKVSSEAKMFVYNLLKFDPRKRWTCKEAINSAWLSRYAPDGVDGEAEGVGSINGESTSGGAANTGVGGGRNSRPGSLQRRIGGNGQTQSCGKGDELDDLPDSLPVLQGSVSGRVVSSMRDYTSYGFLRKAALMVVAYNLAPEKLKDLRAEFTAFDTEKNGIISRSEMEMALKERGVDKDEMKGLFASLDVDNSGNIHYLEFLAATIEAVGTLEEERLQLAFERLDTDGSGSITVSNFKEMCGPIYDDEAIRTALEEVDLSKTGRVDWEAFRRLMHGQPDNSLQEERQAVHKLQDSLAEISPLPSRTSGPQCQGDDLSGGGGSEDKESAVAL